MDSATADTAIVPPLKTQDENPSGDTGDNCPVCLDAIGTRGMVRTACGHAFCFGCFEKFIVLSNSCPLCRTLVLDENSVLEKRIREMPGGEQNMFGESAWEREWATATNQFRDAYRRVRETREANRVREADRAREAEDRVREARDAERAEEGGGEIARWEWRHGVESARRAHTRHRFPGIRPPPSSRWSDIATVSRAIDRDEQQHGHRHRRSLSCRAPRLPSCSCTRETHGTARTSVDLHGLHRVRQPAHVQGAS